jgi:hypothetical protein
MNGWRKRIASSLGGSLLLGGLSVGAALSAESTRLNGAALAAAAAEAKGAVAPLADGAPTIDTRQAFAVAERGAQARVVPVRYAPRAPAGLANVDHCAIVITHPDRPVETVHTIGVGYTETVGCTGLDGIAFPDLDGDGRFDIALIYSTHAPPDRYLKTPVILRRLAGGTFAVDAALGEALERQGGIKTLSALRKAAVARLKGAGR